ncbi:unnamed protein product [Cylicocyclus nassatus]|uniref:Uncharacterized protein n=1 Tax=Cylicocyclus nassatus TaxID=53992 RepID=A0AA36HCQ4_CYLNA|nr:unnamed protein product [Cylicocyclus nassatus]
MLTDLPHVEKVVYDICMKDAKSIVGLAKCSVRVFNTRDSLKGQVDLMSSTSTSGAPSSTITTSPTASTTPKEESSFGKWEQAPYLPIRRKAKVFKTPRILGEYKSKKRRNKTGFKIKRKKGRFLLSTSSSSSRTLRLHPSKERKDTNSLVVKLKKALASGFLHRNRKRAHLESRSWRKRLKRSAADKDVEKTRLGLSSPNLSLRAADIENIFAEVLQGSDAETTTSIPQKHKAKQPQPSSHIEKLLIIRDHFRRVKQCNDFFDNLNERNKMFFKHFKLGIDSKAPTVEKQAASVMDEVVETINAFSNQGSSDKLSLFSPRLLSLLPEASIPNHQKFMSPTLFSFQKEGILSVPELFKLAAISKKEQDDLLEMIIDISGAGKALKEIFAKLEPEMDEIKNVKYPIVQKLMEHDERWRRSRASFTEEQKRDFDEKGFAFLDEKQLNLIYKPEDQLRYGMNTTKLGRMTKQEKQARLEKEIRALAELEKPRAPSWGTARVRRQAEGPINFETLAPVAFATDVLGGASLDIVTLSPRAFIVEVLFPSALIQETLSPRAFIVSILAPNALIARILSPTAFRVEVLSPRALVAWVLSPQAFLVEVLSPNALNPVVLSPDAFVVEVLSPALIAPAVLSPGALQVFVLSPSVLSPRVLSQERLVVEVFSPHILGGEHEHEEAHGGHVVEVGGFQGAHSPHYHGQELIEIEW